MLGRRGIILRGWTGLGLDDLAPAPGCAEATTTRGTGAGTSLDARSTPGLGGYGPGEAGEDGNLATFARERCLFVDDVDHRLVFPRCACVFIHGGASTTTAALLSGRPTFVCPVAFDQFWWGARIVSQGKSKRSSAGSSFEIVGVSTCVWFVERTRGAAIQVESTASVLASMVT